MIRRGKTMNKKEFLKKYNNYSHGYVIEVFKDDKDIEFVFGDRIVIPKREKTTSDTLYDIAIKNLGLDKDKTAIYRNKTDIKKILIMPGSGRSDVNYAIYFQKILIITGKLQIEKIIRI